MPSPRRRSRDRRSRSRSPYRRPPPRRSKSRSPRRRPPPRRSRSRSRTPPRRLSPRRSRTHSPARRPLRRSRSRNRSISPRRRGSPLPRVRPPVRRSPSPRRRPLGPRSLSPRSRPVRRSPKRTSTGQVYSHLEKDRRRQSPHSSTDLRGRRSQSPVLSPRLNDKTSCQVRNLSERVLTEVDVGANVLVAIPHVDREKGDPCNLMAVVTGKEEHGYKLEIKDGILRGLYTRNHFEQSVSNFIAIQSVNYDN
ncbi:unnamed protein product [Mytilus edulis]|uniref:Uncharacterized protein n=1 Tax=Mytilus edulis TaxID=6550 RepID=A0A8S3VE61_MYTED|nr:unnamed protein product [Mytilus edulis]